MLKIRLRRVGGTNAPAYRIVVSDSRRTPTAKIVEELGSYDPTKNPPTVKLDRGFASEPVRPRDASDDDQVRRTRGNGRVRPFSR